VIYRWMAHQKKLQHERRRAVAGEQAA
jgi:hypothetical protein